MAGSPVESVVTEDLTMDAHFHEYLAAVAAMSELYGDRGDEHPSEFHAEAPAAPAPAPVAA